ncbi:MAG: UDP-N-acetylmuramoyl-tripeptide--D-alanyl-D-alanine ligase [Spirochaetales bacterium]|jgi:UDP-N-acetylmuramoyl-tripeptide--D-alanyl-D-alanine ligase|nr:UDP-N-acetylmuramoyl-tripeptide--D-alanyl-D-alanine ligase [Spirochaetales bacterium]
MSERLFTLDEAAAMSGGEVFRAEGFTGEEIFSVAADSRVAGAGALFVPLKGERTDGHVHIAEAFERGARVSLTDKSFWDAHGERLRAQAARPRCAFIIVESSLSALQTLAARYMEGRRALPVCISGSNGKTTTKEITGAILAREAPFFMNRGNLNSEIGLPLSVFEVKNDADFAVFEMGMNHEGEMDVLVNIVKPRAALITNIGTAHIGFLGSPQNIAAEKKKLFLALPPKEKAYVYEGEPFRSFLKEGVAADVLPFGETSTPGFGGYEDLGLDGYSLCLGGETVRFPLPGIYNLRNALGAVSLCRGLGISEKAIQAGLGSVKPLFGRGQIFRADVTVLQDCYNANPQSMQSAIDFLGALAWRGRKIAVLGSMKELGAFSAQEHRNIGARVFASGFNAAFFFGEEMREAFAVLEEERFSGVFRWFADFDGLKKAVVSFAAAGDIVLVKGSRSMELERMTEALAGRQGGCDV